MLHRKEAFLLPDDPRRVKFERLTRQEERAGLLDETATIGTRAGWAERLGSGDMPSAGTGWCEADRETRGKVPTKDHANRTDRDCYRFRDMLDSSSRMQSSLGCGGDSA